VENAVSDMLDAALPEIGRQHGQGRPWSVIAQKMGVPFGDFYPWLEGNRERLRPYEAEAKVKPAHPFEVYADARTGEPGTTTCKLCGASLRHGASRTSKGAAVATHNRQAHPGGLR
jgi:hypothetical protein